MSIAAPNPPIAGDEVNAQETLRVLVVDDEAVNRRLIQAFLEKDGHETEAATNGLEAVELFESYQPNLVLMDLNMPVMNGFEATRQIKTSCGDRFVPVIFLTGAEDVNEMARCLENGGDDLLTKPVNIEMLRAKILAMQRIRKLNQLLLAQRADVTELNIRTQKELEVAEKLFSKITGAGALGASGFRYRVSPASIFNGDLLIAANTPAGHLRVVLGDFTGHGLPAAVGALPMAETFYGMTKKGYALGDTICQINQKLKSILPTGMFCAACFIEVDLSQKTFAIWNGGLPDVHLVDENGMICERVPSAHMSLGIVDANQDYGRAVICRLDSAARILFSTDGVVEATRTRADGTEEMFGVEAFEAALESGGTASRCFDDVLAALDEFLEHESEQCDDITFGEIDLALVAVHDANDDKKGNGDGSSSSTWGFTMDFDPAAIRKLDPRPVIMHVAREFGVPPAVHSDVFLIVAELFTNAVDHGLLKLDSTLKSGPSGFLEYLAMREQRLEELSDGLVKISFRHAPAKGGGILEIRVEDSGDGFDPENRCKSGDCNQELHGRGIDLVKNLCERFDYSDDGSTVEAAYRWEY